MAPPPGKLIASSAVAVAAVGGALLVSSLLGGSSSVTKCNTNSAAWTGSATGAKVASTYPGAEARLVNLINAYRKTKHLAALRVDPRLGNAARFHSRDMQVQGYFDHGLFVKRLGRYTPSSCIAENIALASGSSATPAGILAAWKSDSAQNHVLTLPWATRVGVGIRTGTVSGKPGSTLVTADFSATPKVPPRIPPPVEPPTPQPPPPAPAPPPPPPGTTVGVPYTCRGPVHGVHVTGTGHSSIALVNLAAGCTGDLTIDVTVDSQGGDGVKVQAGAHDLTIGASTVRCAAGVSQAFHQDGVQVQGGVNVTFDGLRVVCPYVTGQGAAAFYIDGKDFPGIRGVVCVHCNLEHLHYAAMWTAPAEASGVRDSILHQGALTGGYYAKRGDGAIDVGNTLAPPCDGAAVPCW